ncbi:PASTA domain-containing protein, partial [Erysipelatoclostridium ramosum]|nr:PASTA domain-containing protein [Thomasclavelia ramosa]
HRTAMIVSIIAAILALGAGGGFALWYFVGPGSYWTLPKPEGLSCAENAPCKITGVKWDAYERLLNVSQIPYKSTQQYSDTVPAGEIISTDPQFVDAH